MIGLTQKLYLPELAMFMSVLYLLASFIHLSFVPAQWDIITRIVFAVACILLILKINISVGKKSAV